MSSKIAEIIDKCKEANLCEIDVRYDEPMSEYTTFKVGGKADCLICPSGEGFTSFCVDLLNMARAEEVPVFILGGGANIVVSDKGIRGIVLNISKWTGVDIQNDEIIVKSGTAIDEAAAAAASANLSGFEFLAGMPGTIGGALWMNARCYGKEISDVLLWVDLVSREKREGRKEEGEGRREKGAVSSESFVFKRFIVECDLNNNYLQTTNHYPLATNQFGYKKSPFQQMDCLIISAGFKLRKGNKEEILIDMEKNRQDRLDKGHYLFPCAGSAFKNNTEFGKPTGQIIDELGLKGLQIGGAQVAPFHGNFIINTGNATASDIRTLMDEVTFKVKNATGFTLEPEILFVGEW